MKKPTDRGFFANLPRRTNRDNDHSVDRPSDPMTPAKFIMGFPPGAPETEMATVVYMRNPLDGDHKEITCWVEAECRVVVKFRVNEPRYEILAILDELRADIARYEDFAMPYVERGVEEVKANNKWVGEQVRNPSRK
jgi:hypothetical protein